MKNFLKKYKKDVMVIAVLLLASIIIYMGVRLYYGKNGDKVQVIVDGELVAVYDIMENNHYKILIGTEYNEILIEDGTVLVSRSSCANQVCVNHTPISACGESIICLPHKLVVKIDEKSRIQKEPEIDGIVE